MIKRIKKRVKKFLKKLKKVLLRPEMVVLPGQIAFFFVLSLVPTITLLSYGASFFHISLDFIFNFVAKFFNEDIASIFVTNNINTHLGFSSFILLLVGYYIASNGASSIIVTSNQIYGIPQKSFFSRKIKSIIMTFIIILLLVFMLVIPVFGNKIIDLIYYVDGNTVINQQITWMVSFLKGPLSWLIIFF